ETLTAPVSVLEELTLEGFNGNDVFIVNRLPASVKLSIRAGFGSDRLDLAPPGSGLGGNLSVIDGAIHFIGGPGSDPGTDTINFYDDQNGADHNYVLSASTFSRTGMDAVTHTRTERFNLWAGWGHNMIRLNSLGVGDEATIDAGGGNDTIVLGNGNLSGNVRGLVDIVTGQGSDELVFDDRNGTVADDFYVFQTGYFQSAVIPVIEWNTDSPPELITLHGSSKNSTTNIQNVADGVTLRVNGLGGNDVMNLHAVEPGGRVRMNGGTGNDTMSLTPVSRNLDLIQGEVVAIGNDGNFDVVNVHDEQNSADGRLYRFNNNRFDVIGSPFDRLTYSGSVEQLHVHAGDNDDVFDVRSTTGPTLVSATGNGGSDTLHVASIARDLDVIQGPLHFAGGSGDGADTVILHDENDTGNDSYSLVTDPPSMVSRPGFLLSHTGVEDLYLNANDGNNNITIGGSWALQTTNYTINSAAGNDTVTINASAPMNVLVNGGTGTLDHVHVRGTLNDDEVTLYDRTVSIGATHVTFGIDVERRSLDAQAGTDLLTVIGVEGTDEHITVRASATPGSGSVQTPSTHLSFVRLEDVTVRGNSGDGDTLAFYGTAAADDFAINPVAQGTADSVVASLGNGFGSTLLRLRDFSHVGIPTFFGGPGADTFRVTVFPTTPEFAIRSVRLNGGTERPGARTAVDTLIMNYNESLFTQLSPPATAPSGTVRLQHEDELLAVLYSNFESVLGNIL
ncbi:MAG: hypothetical protein KDB01_06270, partial [Planctomycetaceae bacterium]|nr:hypothetical protein [Planctomycetaceae bacterium]